MTVGRTTWQSVFDMSLPAVWSRKMGRVIGLLITQFQDQLQLEVGLDE